MHSFDPSTPPNRRRLCWQRRCSQPSTPALPQACTDNTALPSPPGPESGRGSGPGGRQGRLSPLSWGRAGGSRRGPARSWGRTARPARPPGSRGRQRSVPWLLRLLLAQPEARGLGRGPARAASHGAERGRGSQSPSRSPRARSGAGELRRALT